MKNTDNKHVFPVVIEKDDDGYFAYTPEIQGCYTQGKTYEEVVENMRMVIKACLHDMAENKEEIPQGESFVAIASLEVAF